METQNILPALTITRINHSQPYCRQPMPTLTTFGHPQPNSSTATTPTTPDGNSESNPLRMLRSGAFPIVRPKGRITKGEKSIRVPPPPTVPPPALIIANPENESSQVNEEERWRKDSTTSQSSVRKDSITSSYSQVSEDENPIPLPPRDRSRPSVSNKPRHQRKHPLIIPGHGKYNVNEFVGRILILILLISIV